MLTRIKSSLLLKLAGTRLTLKTGVKTQETKIIINYLICVLTPSLGVQILGTKIFISWPNFLFFHVDLKTIKAFDTVKKVSILYLYGFTERRVKVDAVVSVKMVTNINISSRFISQ